MGPTWRCRVRRSFCLLHTVLILILSGQACGLENGFNGNDSCRISSTSNELSTSMCPNKGRCSELLFDCFSCKYDHECIYGQETSGNCTVCDANVCLDETNRPQRVFHVSLPCRYCWQLPPELYKCENRTKCRAVNCPRKRHIVTCTVLADVHCLGKRTFQKMVYCNWTRGYKWSTALALSITLGGFGADRFYLGQWREGLGKLFSFGGLGVWTLLDVILIAVGYIGPVDGSLYI